jgi:hypothetical protein
MNGQLGSLHVGRVQVGGLQDWNLDLTLNESVQDGATVRKLARWTLQAPAYWCYEALEHVNVRLYPDVGKGHWEGKGVVTSVTRKVFDVLIHEEIEIHGEGVLESVED